MRRGNIIFKTDEESEYMTLIGLDVGILILRDVAKKMMKRGHKMFVDTDILQ
jgi:glycerol-3-phosphate responsive antiterminator